MQVAEGRGDKGTHVTFCNTGCKHWLKNTTGLKSHQSAMHSYSFTCSDQAPHSRRASVQEVEDEEALRLTKDKERWEFRHGLEPLQ